MLSRSASRAFVVTTARDLALRRAMLPERRTGATLGDMQLRSHLLNAGSATRGAESLSGNISEDYKVFGA
jgi:hypothetical protein